MLHCTQRPSSEAFPKVWNEIFQELWTISQIVAVIMHFTASEAIKKLFLIEKNCKSNVFEAKNYRSMPSNARPRPKNPQ